MNEVNKVSLYSKDNAIKLSIDGVCINKISYLDIKKLPLNHTEISLTFKCCLETKEQ